MNSGRQLDVAWAVAGAVLIVLATLPYDWQSHSHWARVAWVPFFTGLVRPLDLVVNVFLYLPLGAALQWRSEDDAKWRVAGLCLLLSTTMELAQVWSHDRFPSATDVIMNVFGGFAGAVLSMRWHHRRIAAGKAGNR